MPKRNLDSVATLLGAKIMEKRKAKGFTQAEFADYLDIEQHTLSRIEKGQSSPRISRLPDIANGLGCTISDLFRSTSQLPNVTDEVKAQALLEMIRELPPEQQNMILELIEKTVDVLKKAHKQ